MVKRSENAHHVFARVGKTTHVGCIKEPSGGVVHRSEFSL
jgi:hypothetical protein